MRDMTADGTAGPTPESIGGYQVLDRLGQGGMGEVFLARSSAGVLTAIKVIRPELVRAPGFRKRFAREVTAARRVSGPYTAVLLDAGPEDDRPWLASLYVPAPTLEEAVAAYGPLPLQTLRALAAGLTGALIDVHRAGLVHRDVKPSNVLLALDGPRLIDFGIARAAEDTALTTAGTVLGSPGFMSPEQVAGDPLGPPADIFCLASVLVYAATGAGPFGEGSQLSMLYRVVESTPRLDTVPEELRGLLARGLEKAPADRPTPVGFAARIGPTLLGQPGWLPPPVLADIQRRATSRAAYQATMTGAPEPLPYSAALPLPEFPAPPGPEDSPAGADRPAGGHSPTELALPPAGFTGTAQLSPSGSRPERGHTAGTAGEAVTTTVGSSPPDGPSAGVPAAAPPVPPPPPTGPAHRATPLFRRRAFLAVCGGIAAATAGTYFGLESTGRHADAGTAHSGAPNPGSGAGTGASGRPNAPQAAAFTHRTGGTIHSSPQISPNNLLYIGSDDGKLYALDTQTGATRWTFQTSDIVWSIPAYAENTVYFNSYDHRFYALDATTGKQRWAFTTGGKCCSSPLRYADVLVFGSHDRNVYALTARTGAVRWKYPTGAEVLSSPKYDAASHTLWIGSFDGVLYSLDARTGKQHWAYGTQGSIWSSPALSAGTVFVGSQDHGMYALDAATGKLRWKHFTGGQVVSSPAVSPAGLVYFASEDGKVYALHAANGRTAWTFRTSAPIDSSPTLADGLVYIGGGDGFLYALNPGTGAVVRRFAVGAAVWGTPVVQGGSVYTGSQDHNVYALPTPV
jgi:outer membrane protein assembly factor BamB